MHSLWGRWGYISTYLNLELFQLSWLVCHDPLDVEQGQLLLHIRLVHTGREGPDLQTSMELYYQ